MSSVDLASNYVAQMLEREARGAGDIEQALHRIEAKTGLGYWTLWALRYRKPKTIAADLFQRIRGAYFAVCERELKKLEHELAVEQAKGGGDDLADMVRQAEGLVARLKAAQERQLKP